MSSKGKELTRWGDKAMYGAAEMPTDHTGHVVPRVTLLWATPDPLGAIAAACRMYEGKPTYALASITDEERRHYWEQMKNTHLKAPYEFVKFHFFVEGVDRSFTHQQVRQRTAVFAQESLRFAVKENLADEVVVPPSLADSGESQVFSEPSEQDIAGSIWGDAVKHVEEAYNTLIDMGVPAEDARGLLPHATATRLNYCTDLRNLLDVAGNRLCTQAQFIWRKAFSEIVNAIREYDPLIGTGLEHEPREHLRWQFDLMTDAVEGLFRPVCYQLGHCPFTASFDRGCTIRDRVQAGEWDKISPAEWLLDPTAGRVR